MPRLHLLRHATAAAGYGDEADPGLGEQGRREAEALAAMLGPLGPIPLLVSPLRRCRETAEPLEASWRLQAGIEPAVAEVVAPVEGLAARGEWLRRAMSSRWEQLEDAPRRWRERLLERLLELEHDTVVVTHFVAVNAVLGSALGDDRFLVARVANASHTIVDHLAGELRVVAVGRSAQSEVL